MLSIIYMASVGSLKGIIQLTSADSPLTTTNNNSLFELHVEHLVWQNPQRYTSWYIMFVRFSQFDDQWSQKPSKTTWILNLMRNIYKLTMKNIKATLYEILCLPGFHHLISGDSTRPLTKKSNRFLLLNMEHPHANSSQSVKVYPQFHLWWP